MANTWDTLSWGQGNYGEQNNTSPIPAGLLANLSVGPPTYEGEINEGWGRKGWDTLSWGIAGTLISDGLQLSTSSMTTAIGSVETTADVNLGWGRKDGWGTRGWGNAEQAVTAPTYPILNIGFNGAGVTIDGEINAGWGRESWGKSGWGIQGTLQTKSLQANISTGQVTAIGIVQKGWGREEGWGTRAWGEFEQIAALTGQQLNSSLGTIEIDAKIQIGWGRQEWGNQAWGVAYSAAATGLQLTSSIGEEAAGTNFTAEVSGLQLQTSITPVGTKANNDTEIAHSFTMNISMGDSTQIGIANVPVTGTQMTGTVGQAVGGTLLPVDVSGIGMTASLGNITLIQSTVESITGFGMTALMGDEGPIPQVMVGTTGQQLTSSIGSVGPITGTATVQLTGIVLTPTAGQLNINAWAEIDPDVNNVWTEVDLAA
jgi:hypothetical protein